MLKTTLLKAVEAGAVELRRYFNNEDLAISNKEGINNWVTEADHASEKAIIEAIQSDFPDHFILSEESGETATASEIKWIIDPIDGTINYASGIPICAVSIGVEKNGEMILGAVYNPFINELFLAEKGMGSFLNDKRIRVSRKKEVINSCLVTKGVPVRRLGSAAIDLCWVAAGRFDGFFEHSLSPWDTAAGYLIVEEAGGKVTDMEGNPYSPYQRKLVATNGLIHEELIDVIHNRKQLA